MPSSCCVPHCKGNYRNGPKVSTFSFPREIKLLDRWLEAIRRSSDFRPTKVQRVCELHFNKEDIEKGARFFIQKTGEILTVPLKYPRLVEGAIPTQNLPDCVSRLVNSDAGNKENQKDEYPTITPPPPSKRKKLDFVALQKAYEEKKAFDENQSLKSLDDIMVKFSEKLLLSHWKLVRTDNLISFIHFVEKPYPFVKYRVSISKTMQMSAFSNNIEFKCISPVKGLVNLPSVTTVNNLEQFLENTYNFFEENSQETDSLENNCNMAVDLLEAISYKIPEKSITIKHLQEEIKKLNVATNNSKDFSPIKGLNDHNYCGKGFQLYPVHLKHVNEALASRKRERKRKPRQRRIETRVRLSLKCDLCPKIFASRSGFANHHKLIHQNAPILKDYLCNYCAQRFRTRFQLVSHIRGHTGERPFACKFCNKIFKMKQTLKLHEMNHLGTARYKCETCNKPFLIKAVYEVHRRTHTGEKPFSCNDCGKCFNSRGFWKIHLRIHTGETPYSCPVCCGRYHDKSSLNKHQKAKGHSLINFRLIVILVRVIWIQINLKEIN